MKEFIITVKLAIILMTSIPLDGLNSQVGIATWDNQGNVHALCIAEDYSQVPCNYWDSYHTQKVADYD